MNSEEMKNLIAEYEKKLGRFEKIIKQSDKQQLKLYKLYNTIEEQKNEIEKLYKYNITQQETAKKKLESLIVNDFSDNTDIVFKASDVLSGDYYSLFKIKDGVLIYLLDGQGHGVSPALTIYAIATSMLQILNYTEEFDKIIYLLFKEVKKFLARNEQLSYFIIFINDGFNRIRYAGGGMYPFYFKNKDEILKVKVNNLPFMSFSKIPEISTVDLSSPLKELLLYSDGIIEEYEINTEKYHPFEILKNPSLFENLKNIVQNHDFLDDVTFIRFRN